MFLILLFTLVACGTAAVVRAQTFANPTRSEKLLNGLKLLIWAEPQNPNLTVKLRIHAGSAYDTKGKEGTMQLLADILFNEQSRSYFAEDLGGRLNVETSLDFIEITATGRAANFEGILDTVRTAVTNPLITPENFKKTRNARLKNIAENQPSAAEIADGAARRRLFGEFFPYGKAVSGTPETLAKIDYADLLQARDRLMTSDNATIAIIGNVDAKYALRAVKQFFGSWRKADKSVPSTFRQPDAPAKEFQIVKMPALERAEIRFALRGAARNSADFAAAEILTEILRRRWQNALPADLKQNAFVRHEPHVLPGVVIFGASIGGGYAESSLNPAQAAFAKILSEPISNNEFADSKNGLSLSLGNGLRTAEYYAQNSFDADTFKLAANTKLIDLIAATNLAQVRLVAANWQKQTPAAVAVTQGEGNPQAK